jgi:CheY-like chemotaxis protein
LGSIRGSEESQTDLTIEEGNSTARILIVEDNPVNRKLAETMLKKMGHDPDSVADGSEAMEILKSRKYDVILIDIQMPVLDGFETTRMIRDKKSDVLIHDVPIIAMTAHAMKGDMEKCLAAGMDAYLTKPIQPQKLKEAIGFQLRHLQKTTNVTS